jgi:hypothetical protein
MKLIARLVLAAVAATLLSGAARGQSTSALITVSCSAWASLGQGPLDVTLRDKTPVWVVAAPTQPSDSALTGDPLEMTGSIGSTRAFLIPQQLWARAANCQGSKVVTAPTAGVAAFGPSGKTPVTGSFSAAGQSASFQPINGRAFNITLWGTFSASVQLERSFDSGATWRALTASGVTLYAWTGAASETAEEAEYGVIYRLNCTAYTSGTVNYRISQ